MDAPKRSGLSQEELKKAIESESVEFERSYRWLEEHLPPSFLEEVDPKTRIIIARSLMSFPLQGAFSQLHMKQMAIAFCLDAPDADLRILRHYTSTAIRYYRAFVSNEPPPGVKKGNLRIAVIYFRDPDRGEKLKGEHKAEILELAKAHNPNLNEEEFETLLSGLTPRFLRSMTTERLKIAIDMFFKALKGDQCQYETRRNERWKSKDAPSLQLIMAWRNVPKAGFLYRLAKIINSHGLALKKVSATYIAPYSTDNVLILSLGLHGKKGGAAWEETDIEDFLREFALSKFFEIDDPVGTTFVQTELLSGNEGHLVRNFISFVHQVLVYADPNLYSLDNVIEGFCRHPKLTVHLAKAFEMKFHPQKRDAKKFEELKVEFLASVENLDTGQAVNDLRRKNILRQGLNFVEFTLKTNFYQHNKSSFSFRLAPGYLDDVPYARAEKFPELPYAIFFIRGMHFIGFNIRFKDLARGGVRTVFPERREQFAAERNSIFSEAYNLAYTQHKKNKDIPEGGAKTAILLKPFDVYANEESIYKEEMEEDGLGETAIEDKLQIFRREHRTAYLFSSQRCFVDSFMTLINCDDSGKLKADSVVDYWKKPEYIYLGPDENMSNEMIVWIADFAVQSGYKPGRSFMSSKPGAGINHKEFGVTSFGVNVYLHETLLFLGMNPLKDPFTIKISGGPDGDVAGNELLNLYKYYPKTAKLLAVTDVSGTIYDPKGLDLSEIAKLFHAVSPIRNYPPEKLSDGGFLLDLKTKREESAFAQQTLIWRKKEGKAVQDWLSGNEMNHLYRSNVHQVKTDVFVPGGGRPRTLNESNYTSYLDELGKPTSKAIVEGANLYLTPLARRELEKLGLIILKDSSCNKGGVITSSFEVLSSLCMSEADFLAFKDQYVKEVLEIIKKAAEREARLLLETHQKTGAYLTDISDKISEKINLFKYQLLDYLETRDLPEDPDDPLIRCLLLYCPPLLRTKYRKGILSMPAIHKKAVIACYIAARLVYSRGLEWSPSIADILPTLKNDPHLMSEMG
jgi:glutamate dehydrogenase